MVKLVFIFLSVVYLLAACSGVKPTESASNSNVPPSPVAQPTPDEELQKQIAEIAKEANGKVGVYATLIETGESVSLNENERFAMQSVVKLPIAMAVLNKIDVDRDQKLRDRSDYATKVTIHKDEFVPSNMHSPIRDNNPNGTEMTIHELIRYAISESDGTASDVLQRVAGGDQGVQDFIDLIDVRDMKVTLSHKEFGAKWELQYENWATPRATFELLHMLWLASTSKGYSTQHSRESYELLEKYMTESNNPPNRLKGMLPKGTIVAHKTGTGGTQNGITSATNDVGIITLPNGNHVAIAVFVGDSKADLATREGVIAKIAKAAFDKWSVSSEPVKTADLNERHTLN